MKQIIDKLIQSDNTEDWLIAYELIIKEYGSLESYPNNECAHFYTTEENKLWRVYMVNYNGWKDVFVVDLSKYAQL